MRLSNFTAERPLAQCASALLLAVLASASAAALVVQWDYSSRPARSRAAGLQAMTMLAEEHASVAGYAAGVTQAQNEANRAAEQDAIAMKTAAAEQAASDEKLALLETAGARPASVVPPAPVVQKSRQLALRELQPAAPPLQLAAMMQPVPARLPARLPAGGLVTRRAREVIATVERIPGWVREAANWVVDVPAQALPRWPRRFNISSL
jgi:hypothetical protein